MAKRPTQDRDDQPTTSTASGPRELPLVALRETVIFPEMIGLERALPPGHGRGAVG